MKIYSWITNEKGIQKTQGAQKELTIEIQMEYDGKDWRALEFGDKTHIVCHYENGEPVIRIVPGKVIQVKAE